MFAFVTPHPFEQLNMYSSSGLDVLKSRLSSKSLPLSCRRLQSYGALDLFKSAFCSDPHTILEISVVSLTSRRPLHILSLETICNRFGAADATH
jgi:hypothetical protein